MAIQGTTQDITESKLAQEALRERDSQLTGAQRAARLGWWERDLASGRLTWSDEICHLWGFDAGRVVSFEQFMASVRPDHRQGLLEAGRRLVDNEEPFCVDFRVTIDRRQRWFRGGAHLLRDKEGKPVKIFGTAQDVTEQKQVEHEPRTAKDLYQRILETTHEGVLAVDAEHVITFVNARNGPDARLHDGGADRAACVGVLGRGDSRPASSHRPRRRQGMSEHYQTQLLAKDGAAVQVLVSASPFMDAEGHYAGPGHGHGRERRGTS